MTGSPSAAKQKMTQVARAVQNAATSISLTPTARWRGIKSKKHTLRLRKRQIRVKMEPLYRPPILRTHFIPDRHVPPTLSYPTLPSPQSLVEFNHLRVDEDETHDIPSVLPDKFAVFAPDGYKDRQHKVMVNDRIMVTMLYNKCTGYPYQVGAEVLFDNVLCVGSRQHTAIGRPLIRGATVKAVVEEITQLAKLRWIWKKKIRRKQRIVGYRNVVTILRITEINCDFAQFVSDSSLKKFERREMVPSLRSHTEEAQAEERALLQSYEKGKGLLEHESKRYDVAKDSKANEKPHGKWEHWYSDSPRIYERKKREEFARKVEEAKLRGDDEEDDDLFEDEEEDHFEEVEARHLEAGTGVDEDSDSLHQPKSVVSSNIKDAKLAAATATETFSSDTFSDVLSDSGGNSEGEYCEEMEAASVSETEESVEEDFEEQWEDNWEEDDEEEVGSEEEVEEGNK